jgi:class 3 adenylate cyclase
VRFKLRTQLAFIFTVFSVTGIILFYLYTVNLQRQNFREDFNKRIEQFVDTMKLGLEVGLTEENFSTIQKVFEWARKEPSLKWIILLDQDGELFASFPDDFKINKENLPELINPNNNFTDSGTVRTTNWSSPILKGSMYINFSNSELLKRENALLHDTAISALVSLIVIIFIVWILASVITHPLERLRNLTWQISKGDLSIRFKEIWLDSREISSVGKYFNDMMTSLESYNHSLRIERAKSEELLYNVLPNKIADRLKKGETTIADHLDRVSVMFIDLVGFTDLAGRISPHNLIEILNNIFSAFDVLTEIYKVEKIKTIGDSYMVVGGLDSNEPQTDTMIELAFAMQETLEKISKKFSFNLNIRTGIHVGPIVAGVIGKNKYTYDIWGDTVNIASRMEARGEANRIHLTSEAYRSLQKKYSFTDRGEIEIKGKGNLHTYFIDHPRLEKISS